MHQGRRCSPERSETQTATTWDAKRARNRARSQSAAQTFRPTHVITDHRPQALQPVRAEKKPELEGAEASAEGHRPLRIVDDAIPPVRLQIFRTNGKRADEAVGIADEVRRAVELRAEPFVRVEDNRIS